MPRLFDTDQPADGLEDELRRMLAVREADIIEPARPGSDGHRLQLPAIQTHRLTELPGGRTGTLLAAAVVALLVLGSAFATRALNHPNNGPGRQPALNTPAPRPTPTQTQAQAAAKSCPLPASWATALAGGRIAVDQPQNYPVSAGPDGTFLMLQSATGQVNGQTDFTHQELAIFDRNGHGSTIWQAADPAHDEVDYSPDSAISSDWVVFGLSRSQNLAAHGVVAWNRSAEQPTTVRTLSAAEQHANLVIAFDPIVAGDTAYWIEQKYGDDAHQTLVGQQLPDGHRSTEPVSGVDRLLALGGGVALLHSTGALDGVGFRQSVVAGPGLTMPAAVQAAAQGYWFGTDGTTLRWLSDQASMSWAPGQAAVDRTLLHGQLGGMLVGPFAGQTPDGEVLTNAVLDTRNNTKLPLPTGLRFALITGGDLITVTGANKFGPTTVRRVPLTALPPVTC